MSGRHWTPFQLDIVLHHYASTARYPRENTPIYSEEIRCLMDCGLIEYREGIPRTTRMGDHFVEMLLQTPLPREVWVDPRTRQEILSETP